MSDRMTQRLRGPSSPTRRVTNSACSPHEIAELDLTREPGICGDLFAAVWRSYSGPPPLNLNQARFHQLHAFEEPDYLVVAAQRRRSRGAGIDPADCLADS